MLLCLLSWIIITNIGCTSKISSFLEKEGSSIAYPSEWKYLNDLLLIEPRRRRESYISCSQSPIQTNMTLKGGIQAGYFRKLAEHVAMQLCVELCCEDKGCDVAFMSGKSCYGVQCFNEELCRAFPAKREVNEPVFISHVTFKGEKVVPREEGKAKLQCVSTRINIGATLHGGLQAGNFTDVGIVEDPKVCVNLCCVSEHCNVAMLINEHCFLVSCFSTSLCQMTRSLTPLYMSSLAYVRRKVQNRAKEGNVSLPHDTSESQLVCKNSEIFYNSTLKGGYHAGNYSNFGVVPNINACIRWCCGNRDCDAAFMLENNCFAVACRNPDDCLPVHAKSSSSSAALKPRITYITSRSEEVGISEDVSTGGICHAGIISYDVTLRGGSNAGKFTPHGVVNNMKTCIFKCCQSENCNVAMMLKDSCFTVICDSEEKCEKRQTQISSNFNPRIAYVFRDKGLPSKKTATKKKTGQVRQNHETMKHKKKMMLIEQLHALTSPYDASTLYPDKSWYVSAEKSAPLSPKELSPLEEPSPLFLEKQSLLHPQKSSSFLSQERPYSLYSQEPSILSPNGSSLLAPQYPSLLPPDNKSLLSSAKPSLLSLGEAKVPLVTLESKYDHMPYNILSTDNVTMPKELSNKYTLSSRDIINMHLKSVKQKKMNKFSESNYMLAKEMNTSSHVKGKAKTYLVYNDSQHMFTHILQSINRSSTPPLYDFLLGNFDFSQSRRPVVNGIPGKRPSVSPLTKQQLIKIQLNKTLEAMDLSFDRNKHLELFNHPLVNRYLITKPRNKITPYTWTEKPLLLHVPVVNLTKVDHPSNLSSSKFIHHIRPYTKGSKNLSTTETPIPSDDGMMNTSLTITKMAIPDSINIRKNEKLFDTKKRLGAVNDINGKVYSKMDEAENASIQFDGSEEAMNGITSQQAHSSNMSIETGGLSNNSQVSTYLPYISNKTMADVNLSTTLSSTYTPRDISFINTTINTNTSLGTPKKYADSSRSTDSTDYISDAISNSGRPYTTDMRIEDEEGNCFRSKIFYNVTLRGGYDSGKFKDRGKMKDVIQCARLCCHLNKCDLVMMLADRCFSVHCKNARLCESIPAKSPIYSPTICYVRHG